MTTHETIRTVRTADPNVAPEDRPLSELVQAMSTDSALLVRQEVELFKQELSLRMTSLKTPAAGIAIGGVLALVGVLALTATLVLLLALVMDLWLAALIVGALYLIGAGILISTNKKKLEEAQLKPDETLRSSRESLRSLKEAWR